MRKESVSTGLFKATACCALLAIAALVTACSDSADSSDAAQRASCDQFAADIPTSVTPPAPAASCPVPASPISSLIESQASQRQATLDERRAALLDPAKISVVTCGTGSPIPSARAQSCVAVFVNGQFLLFDAGNGAQDSMEDLNLPVADIDAVFLTHFHSDHIADLGEVLSRSWILGRDKPFTVYGGEGVERVVVGFNTVYDLDDAYRAAHHGEDLFPPVRAAQPITLQTPGAQGSVVYDQLGVRVLAFKVDHSPVTPALGYRVEYAGKAVGISGDTIDTAGLRALAENADILVSEVINKSVIEDFECALGRLADARNERIFRDIRTYHIDIPELATLAEESGVRTLVLTHLVPSIDNPAQIDLFFRQPAAALFSGELVVAEDGTELTIPIQ